VDMARDKLLGSKWIKCVATQQKLAPWQMFGINVYIYNLTSYTYILQSKSSAVPKKTWIKNTAPLHIQKNDATWGPCLDSLSLKIFLKYFQLSRLTSLPRILSYYYRVVKCFKKNIKMSKYGDFLFIINFSSCHLITYLRKHISLHSFLCWLRA
jgi:hypothetical protein